MNKSSFSLKNIHTRLFIFITVPVFLIITAISTVVYLNQRSILFNLAKEKAFGLTRILAYSSLNAVLSDEYLMLQQLIDSMSDGRDIKSIDILDTEAVVIASNNTGLRGKKLADEFTQRAVTAKIFLLQNVQGDIWDTAVPIYKLEERIGTARITFSVENTFMGLQKSIFIIGTAALILGLILAYLAAKTYTQPIRKAIELANEYGKGNLNASIDLERDDDIGQLISSLNALSQNLKKLIEEKVSIENLALIGEFSSYIIHDLKNPIAGISLLAQGIDENVAEDSSLKEYTMELIISARKIEKFLKTVLDLASPQEIYAQKVQINELLTGIINDFEWDSIELETRFNDRIPEIDADNNLIRRALLNLIQNSKEALTSKGKITISTFQSDNKVCIAIEDNGKGIPQEKLGTIFRPFFTEKSSGHGLGLAMVKRVVIAHQGTIEVESEPGEYTRFILAFPTNL